LKVDGALNCHWRTANIRFIKAGLCYLDNMRYVFRHGETEAHYDSPRNADTVQTFLESLAPEEAEPLTVNSTRAVAAFMFCTVLASSLPAQDTSCHPRLISVTGTAEIKVVPDEVAITLGVDSRDKDLAVAKADNDLRMKKLLSVAHAASVESKYIQTSALTMGPEYSDERIPKFLDYQVSQVVIVTLTDLSKYEDLMTNSLKAGVNRVDGVNFFVADPTKYREQARLQALRAARDKAKAMAAELG